MRQHVTPADPAATILDPERSDKLPPEGRTVTWSAYWAGLKMREDITVSEPPVEAEVPPADPAESDATEAGHELDPAPLTTKPTRPKG